MDEKTLREQFIQQAVHMMAKNPGAQIMVIVDHQDGGLETMHSNQSYIWMLGVLSCAEKITDERFRAAMGTEDARRRESQLVNELNNVTKDSGGKAN